LFSAQPPTSLKTSRQLSRSRVTALSLCHVGKNGHLSIGRRTRRARYVITAFLFSKRRRAPRFSAKVETSEREHKLETNEREETSVGKIHRDAIRDFNLCWARPCEDTRQQFPHPCRIFPPALRGWSKQSVFAALRIRAVSSFVVADDIATPLTGFCRE
jgi:hypothetical protein